MMARLTVFLFHYLWWLFSPYPETSAFSPTSIHVSRFPFLTSGSLTTISPERRRVSWRSYTNFRGFSDDKETEEQVPDKKREPPPKANGLVRLIDNFWYAMTAPFPDLRKLSRKREVDERFAVSLRLQDGLAAVLAYMSTGVVCYHFFFEKWSIIDSLYFNCVCFSTTG
jgi:hypothetical protein